MLFVMMSQIRYSTVIMCSTQKQSPPPPHRNIPFLNASRGWLLAASILGTCRDTNHDMQLCKNTEDDPLYSLFFDNTGTTHSIITLTDRHGHSN